MYLLDYVRAYGSVPRTAEPYNEVDMLAFASLSYLELNGIVSERVAGEDRLMRDVAAEYRKRMEGDPNPPGLFIPRDFIDILIEMENAPRYNDLKVFGFRSEWSLEQQKQFASLGLETSDGSIILSFAGTDDTMLGWREDLNLAVNGVIASQPVAVAYVNEVLENRKGFFTTCGFSKGGHLAVYAAAKCTAPERLLRAYDYDGPGFRDDFLASDGFKVVASRCILIAPRYSAVSRMLNNVPLYAVTVGTRRGLYQHYSNRWIIEGNRFLREPDFAPGAKQFHDDFMKLLRDTPEQHRQLAMDTVFDITMETGVNSLTEVWKDRRKHVPEMLSAVKSLPKEQRAIVFPFLKRMLRMTMKYYSTKR